MSDITLAQVPDAHLLLPLRTSFVILLTSLSSGYRQKKLCVKSSNVNFAQKSCQENTSSSYILTVFWCVYGITSNYNIFVLFSVVFAKHWIDQAERKLVTISLSLSITGVKKQSHGRR